MSALFCFRDLRAEMHRDPFPSINASTAIRETMEHISSGRLPANYASDFALFQVATFDPESGRVTPMDPKHVIDCLEIVKDVEDNG